MGVLPALFTLWIRRRVAEPPVWAQRRAAGRLAVNPFGVLFGRKLVRRTVLATLIGASVQFAYWGLFFWLPSFLATPVEQGGAGMTIVRSMSWIIPMQVGAYFGYLSFGFIADRLGRRPTFALFLATAAVLVPIYGQLARSPAVLMMLGPILGFVGHGYFSMFGAFLAELFPTAVRATGQGLTYNLGRGLGALAPYTIGALATVPQVGIGSALALTSAFFLTGALLLFALPDTSGKPLED
jgi:MFS family permease